jgi:hypothetical protein
MSTKSIVIPLIVAFLLMGAAIATKNFQSSQDIRSHAAAPIPPTGVSRVFVTRDTYSGALGGLSGADAICQKIANDTGLGGSWKAWLSNRTTSVASRFKHSQYPYILLNGLVIANNWTDLTDGSIQYPINMTQYQLDLTDSPYPLVWTNTLSNGELNSSYSDRTCQNWTSGWSGNVYKAYVGLRLQTNNQWSGAHLENCSIDARLYCFDQTIIIPKVIYRQPPNPQQ